MTQINYVEFIKTAKNAARDVLRTEKVQALLGYISNVEQNIADVKARIERNNLELSREEYELRIATQFESPDLESKTKFVESQRTAYAERNVELEKEITEHEAKITEYKTKIENWHNGTSKVDADRMNEMAIKFVKEKVGTDFNMGLYEQATTEPDAN